MICPNSCICKRAFPPYDPRKGACVNHSLLTPLEALYYPALLWLNWVIYLIMGKLCVFLGPDHLDSELCRVTVLILCVSRGGARHARAEFGAAHYWARWV